MSLFCKSCTIHVYLTWDPVIGAPQELEEQPLVHPNQTLIFSCIARWGTISWWNSPWFLQTYCWQKVFLHQYVWYMKQTDWRFFMYDKNIDATLAEQPNRRDVCSCWPLLIVNNHPELQNKFLLCHNVRLFFGIPTFSMWSKPRFSFIVVFDIKSKMCPVFWSGVVWYV